MTDGLVQQLKIKLKRESFKVLYIAQIILSPLKYTAAFFTGPQAELRPAVTDRLRWT